MPDYSSIEALGQDWSNAEIIRSNSKNDDGTDMIAGAAWFSYRGIVCSSLYLSGNSWFGFGSSEEHLKVNRRDAASYTIKREECTLYGYYKILKLYWMGYSHYSATSSSAKLEYEVYLFDTGTIMLHMLTKPTRYADGAYSLGGAAYTVEQGSYVTFYLQEDGSYLAVNEVIDIPLPYDRKYLVRESGICYTVRNNALQAVDAEILAAEVFREYGIDKIPDGALLAGLTQPELLYWQDSDKALPELRAIVTAVPPPQYIISGAVDLTDPTVQGISSVTVDADGAPLFSVSFDGGIFLEWREEGWRATDEGMNPEEIGAVSQAQWMQAISGVQTLKIRALLRTTEDVLRSAKIKFINVAEEGQE